MLVSSFFPPSLNFCSIAPSPNSLCQEGANSPWQLDNGVLTMGCDTSCHLGLLTPRAILFLRLNYSNDILVAYLYQMASVLDVCPQGYRSSCTSTNTSTGFRLLRIRVNYLCDKVCLSTEVWIIGWRKDHLWCYCTRLLLRSLKTEVLLKVIYENMYIYA